ncbi:hypothetical protein FRC10_002558 [Ceratobasidium sp. 414]|nr:hypothetical protein FRC10_002558 [Ceratobasidium sp. 414]
MAPCNCPTAKQRRTTGAGRANAPRTAPSDREGNFPSSAQQESPPSTSDDPKIIVDELDGVLQLPGDVDEGRELHDTGVVQKSVLAAANQMRLKYGLIMSDEEAHEVQDLFPKANEWFAHHLHKSSTDYATFVNIGNQWQDSIPSNVEVPSTVDATRWNSELKCSETYRTLRKPTKAMIADETYEKKLKYRLTPGQ